MKVPNVIFRCVTLDCNKRKTSIFLSSENDDDLCRFSWNFESDEYCSGNTDAISTPVSSECTPDSITDNLTDIPLKEVKFKQLNRYF